MNIQTKSFLPIILILLALIFGFVFYFQVIKPGQVNQYEIPAVIQGELIRFRAFKDLQLNFLLFERTEFKSLRIFGEVPVKPVPGGKTDLFSQ